MNKLENQDLTVLVSNAFSSYIESSEKIVSIRESNLQYLNSLAQQICMSSDSLPNPSKSIPDYVTGYLREYLSALIENLSAKDKFDSISNTNDFKNPTQKLDSNFLIDKYSNVSKLQEQNHKLAAIKHYTAEAKIISKEQAVFDLPTVNQVDHGTFPDLKGQETTKLIETFKNSTRQLELAVIKARHHLTHERNLLQTIRERRSESVQKNDFAQLHALAAMRDELTLWLEETLAKCSSKAIQEDANTEVVDDSNSPTNVQLEQDYEQYIRARRKVLEKMTMLKSSTENSLKIDMHLFDKPQKQTKLIPTNPILPAMENSLIPMHQLEQEVDRQKIFTNFQLEKEFKDTDKSLERLGNESQLLSSYPILANSERFRHARAVAAGSSSQENEMDKISKLVEAWSFASNAANDTFVNTIESHSKQGQQALFDANHHIQNLKYLQSSND